MSKISFFKKVSLFLQYLSSVRKNIKHLNSSNIRVDMSYRLYTVFNVPDSVIPEAYDLKKSDIDKLSQSYIMEYVRSISLKLDEIGLNELYTTYKVDKVDKYSYLIVIGYKFFNSVKFFKRLLLFLVSFLLISIFIYYL